MDHLGLPADPAHPAVRVPYLCTCEYDGKAFGDYPARMGWRKSHFFTIGWWLDRDPAEAGPFLQNWLYFGLLDEFFGVHVKSSDFVVDGPAGKEITTRMLGHYRRDWVHALVALDQAQRKERLRSVEACLAEVSRFMLISDVGIVPEVLDPAVALSIQVLGTTLSYLKRVVWDMSLGRDKTKQHTRNEDFGRSKLVRSRAQAAGWCPSEIARIPTITSQYWVSAMKRMTTEEAHSECAVEGCIANNIDEETYKTKHWQSECECGFRGPAAGELESILKTGRIPVIKLYMTTGLQFLYAVVPYEPDIQYVAISHVWSDGLGNPRGNTLPGCQLKRLFGILNDLDVHVCKKKGIDRPYIGPPVYLWLDTLCVPLEPQFRKLAIQKMKDTYEHAERVLVIDAELEKFCNKSLQMSEACFRICGSRWMGRVWTLQEGILARSIWIHFADSIIELDVLLLQAVKQTMDPQWMFDVLAWQCSDVGMLRTIRGMQGVERMNHTWKEFTNRSTSRSGDEIICFSSILGLDTTPVSNEDDVTQRLKALVQQLDEVPLGLLWGEGPRINDDGYRWLPNSILGFRGQPVIMYTMEKAMRVQRGIRFKHPGYIFNRPRVDEWSMNLFFDRRVQEWLFFGIMTTATNQWNWDELGTTKTSKCALIMEDSNFDITSASRDALHPAIIVSVYEQSDGIIYTRFKCRGSLMFTETVGMKDEVIRKHKALEGMEDAIAESGSSRTPLRLQLENGVDSEVILDFAIAPQDQEWCVG